MPLKPAQVRALLNAAELDLYEASRAGRIKELTAAQVRSKVSRTRLLRDKYQDLTQRQKLASRDRTSSKGGVSGTANQRTEEKILVLTDVLRTFEKRMEQLAVAQERQAPGAVTRAGSPATTGKGRASSKGAPEPETRAASAKRVRSRAPKEAAPSPEVKKSAATTLRELMDKKSTEGSASPRKPTMSAKVRRTPSPAGQSGAAQTDKTMTTGNAPRSRAGGAQIQGHSAAQVRRGQVKRDSRG